MNASSTWLELIHQATTEQLLAPIVVISLVGGLCIWYWIRYYRRSTALGLQLSSLIEAIKSVQQLPKAKRRAELNRIFTDHPLQHAWQEFAETLHDQYELKDGEQHLKCSRATAGAAHFFSAQSVVETPLSVDFFKHLPGILTGIGIVGTFWGLMTGLRHFNPGSPEQVNASVDQLLKDVMFAFVGSGASIAASIGVTWSEKLRLARCYKLLEELTESIDALFDSGVGEEYLADLVKSSNESSVQTRLLKDSLVTDLREMLQNLVDSQVRENLKLAESLSGSYRESGQLLAEQVSGAIENSLKSPLEAIAGAVQTASGDQSNQVQSLLQDVLVAFMNKLETTFGQQFSGMHQMLGDSVAAMQSMQQGFNALVSDMRSASEASSENSAKLIAQMLADMQAGQNNMQAAMNEMLANLQSSISRIGSESEGAGERMAQQLERLFADSEARQAAMADSLQTFVEAIKQNVGQGQQETMAKIAGSVEVLGEQLGGLFKQMEHNREQMDLASRSAQNELHQGTREMVGGLEKQVEQLLNHVAEQNTTLQNTLQQIGEQTQRHLQSMEQGADKMRQAADRFDVAGQSVTKASEASAGTMQAMQNTSTALVGASHELGSVVADYRNNRDALDKTLTVIQGVVAGAQAEAMGRSQYLLDLKQQGERLQALNREMNDYLNQISDVLGKGFNEFSDGMGRSLQKTLGALDVELHKAVTNLAGGVDDVRESLDNFSDIMERVQRK